VEEQKGAKSKLQVIPHSVARVNVGIPSAEANPSKHGAGKPPRSNDNGAGSHLPIVGFRFLERHQPRVGRRREETAAAHGTIVDGRRWVAHAVAVTVAFALAIAVFRA